MSEKVNRRNFFRNSLFTASGLMLGSKIYGAEIGEFPINESKSSSFNIMKEVMKYRKISAHAGCSTSFF